MFFAQRHREAEFTVDSPHPPRHKKRGGGLECINR